MIDILTKENLQKLGFEEATINILLNFTEDDILHCNDGKIFVSI